MLTRAERLAHRAAQRDAEERILARNPAHPVIDHIVDKRTFLLGLDDLYRNSMARHEGGELLVCARAVAATLRVPPADGPVEGYYAEDERLTEYFQLMRGFGGVSQDSRRRVAGMPEFARLLAVTSSALYGTPTDDLLLLPVGRDVLYHALSDEEGSWSVQPLVERAYKHALDSDEFSLVALAALARDAVVLAALRESVVVYSAVLLTGLGAPAINHYIWRVDEVIAERAGRFVSTFNALFREELPEPVPDNAEDYFTAGREAHVGGRCACIGSTPRQPVRYYHWAIRGQADGTLGVHDFWADELWTTARYALETARAHMPERFRR